MMRVPLNRRGDAVFKTIVVATDGSELADPAVSLAGTLARESSGRLIVVHVHEFAGSKSGVYSVDPDEPEALTKIRRQVSEMESSGVKAELLTVDVVLGGPASAIAQTATAQGAELIVAGTRGLAALPGLLAGSVAQRLLHLAHCPVLIVPPHRDRSS